MSGSIPDLLLGVRAGVAALAPTARSVEIHRGRFRLADVTGNAMQTPALRLGLMGIRRIDTAADGQRDVTLRLSCAVVTVDRKDLTREAAANALVNDLVLGIDGATWGLDYAHGATDLSGENLFTGDVGAQGIMVWELTWSQTIRMGVSAFVPADGSLPEHLHVGWSPKIGAAHEADYVEITAPEDAP